MSAPGQDPDLAADEEVGAMDVTLVITPSLHAYFIEGVLRDRACGDPEAELVRFLTMVLNDTLYPLASVQTGEREIRLTYRPRAFADPIF